MKQWELWMAHFPLEEDPNVVKKRPVIILNIEPLEVLSVKVTSHGIRTSDKYDVPIINWASAGLDRPSVARISKTIKLTHDKFQFKIGNLDSSDCVTIMQKYIEYINDTP